MAPAANRNCGRASGAYRRARPREPGEPVRPRTEDASLRCAAAQPFQPSVAGVSRGGGVAGSPSTSKGGPAALCLRGKPRASTIDTLPLVDSASEGGSASAVASERPEPLQWKPVSTALGNTTRTSGTRAKSGAEARRAGRSNTRCGARAATGCGAQQQAASTCSCGQPQPSSRQTCARASRANVAASPLVRSATKARRTSASSARQASRVQVPRGITGRG